MLIKTKHSILKKEVEISAKSSDLPKQQSSLTQSFHCYPCVKQRRGWKYITIGMAQAPTNLSGCQVLEAPCAARWYLISGQNCWWATGSQRRAVWRSWSSGHFPTSMEVSLFSILSTGVASLFILTKHQIYQNR